MTNLSKELTMREGAFFFFPRKHQHRAMDMTEMMVMETGRAEELILVVNKFSNTILPTDNRPRSR
jgi:hypothetical protein